MNNITSHALGEIEDGKEWTYRNDSRESDEYGRQAMRIQYNDDMERRKQSSRIGKQYWKYSWPWNTVGGKGADTESEICQSFDSSET